MFGDGLTQLFFLILLGGAVGGWFMLSNRGLLKSGLRNPMVWGFVFLGGVAGYGLWSDLQGNLVPRQSVIAEDNKIVVPRSLDGHYYVTLDANGTSVRFVVDTGATDIVLTRADAQRIGIRLSDLAFSGEARTANGTVRTARIRLDTVDIGPIRDRNVSAVVNQGEMDGSLLGMSYLSRFGKIEIEADRLILTR